MLILLKVCIGLLVLLMAVRAFQSATTADRALGVFLLVGLVTLVVAPISVATILLLPGCVWYLLSQVLTGARVVSRALPLLAGVLVMSAYLL